MNPAPPRTISTTRPAFRRRSRVGHQMQKSIFQTLAALSLLAAGAPPAEAADAESDTSSIDGSDVVPEKKHGKDKGKKDKDKDADWKQAIEFKGRVFVLAERQSERIDAGQGPVETRIFGIEVPSARAGVKVRIRDGIQLVLEADFSGKPSIKDGFVQAKGKHWLVRAGRFKMPISSFTL